MDEYSENTKESYSMYTGSKSRRRYCPPHGPSKIDCSDHRRHDNAGQIKALGFFVLGLKEINHYSTGDAPLAASSFHCLSCISSGSLETKAVKTILQAS
jgi:hypothetical protein